MGRRPRTYANLELNPIRRVRKGNSRTLEQASSEACVNLQTWYLSERGVYPEIPKGVLEQVSDWPHTFPVEVVLNGYREYQTASRRGFWGVHGDRIISALRAAEDKNLPPDRFVRLVISASNETDMGFAKGMCIPPAVVYAILNRRRQSLPGAVVTALLEAGLPNDVLLAGAKL